MYRNISSYDYPIFDAGGIFFFKMDFFLDLDKNTHN